MKYAKAKTRKQLAEMIGISRATFHRWLKKEGIKLKPGLITVDDQIEIFNRMKMPLLARRVLKEAGISDEFEWEEE